MKSLSIPLARRLSTLPRRVPRAGFVKNTVGYESFTKFDAAQASRRQHQLATMDDQMLRDQRRLLLLSLQEFAYDFPQRALKFSSVSSLPVATPVEEKVSRQVDDSDLDDQEPAVLEVRQDLSQGGDRDGENFDEKPSPIVQTKKASEMPLWSAIRNGDTELASKLFKQAMKDEHKLSIRVLARLFYVIVSSDPMLAYSVLKLYRQEGPTLTDPEMNMYLKLISSIKTLDPYNHPRNQAFTFVEEILGDLEDMGREAKQELLPKLITALASQRIVRIGVYAGELYKYMAENNYEMRGPWLRQLLNLSKYNRQEDLPFEDILARLADGNFYVHPLLVIQAIHNMFPFTNPDIVCPALIALLQLQQRTINQAPAEAVNFDKLLVDLDCIDLISMGAAHSGSSEQIFLVWELLEQCNYRPTETIYENTVITLAVSQDSLEAAFGALNSMREAGYDVSRSLIRSLSLALRSDKSRLDDGVQLLRSSPELLSFETLNVLMSCYAERGDVHDTLEILSTMRDSGLEPDLNSYSFAIEVLGKDIHRYGKADKPALMQENLDHADAVLKIMEEAGIRPSRELLRNYIELLCIAGETETANLVVDDLLSTSGQTSVCSKTLYRLAMANATEGDFKRARHLASLVTDEIPILLRKIRSKEQRFRRF